MKPLKAAWRWLSQSKNQKTLSWISGGLIVVAGGLWQGYLHFSEKPKNEPTPTISAAGGGIAAGGNVSATAAPGGNAVINTGSGSITIGISLEQYAAGLKRREQEVRAQLREVSGADKERIALLEKELADAQAKIKSPESGLEDFKAILAQAHKTADDFKREVLPEQIKQAQEALTRGETTDAERLFTQILTHATANAAEAAYQLGQLAYARIAYQTADRYYRQAVQLQPDNPHYLDQAGFIAHTIGHYAESERLLQRALVIREKTLGPEHPDVALSLHKLATLYYEQGQYGKAEPLLRRELEIREKARGPEHPDVVAVLSNLATLHNEQGHFEKAEPLYQRALAIQEKAFGPDDPRLATVLVNLA